MEPTTESETSQSLRQPIPKRIWCILVLIAILAGVLLFPFPMTGRAWNAFFDMAHAPSFFLATIILAALLDPAFVLGIPARPLVGLTFHRFLMLAFSIAAVGAVCEIGQAFVGRSPSPGDALANSSGALSAALLVFALRRWAGIRRALAILVAAALFLITLIEPMLEIQEAGEAVRDFPLIASFERPRELRGWDSLTAELDRSDEWASMGKFSLRIRRPGNHHMANAIMLWPPEDWSNFEFFEFQVRNAGTEPVRLHLNLADLQHTQTGFEPTDRFHREFFLPADSVTPISVPLVDVRHAPLGREMNMRSVSFVNVVFDKKNDLIVFLDALKLTTSKEK